MTLTEHKNAAISRGVGMTTQIYADRAENSEIWDKEGHRYIDFASGIAVVNTGHRHPRVIAAVKEQLDRFTHTCHQVVPYESYVHLAERLNAIVPGDFAKKTIFVTTGAEAVENAVKIARAATGRSAIIAFGGGFHGRTFMGMALTGKVAPYKIGFGPMPGDVFHAPFPVPLHGVSVDIHEGEVVALVGGSGSGKTTLGRTIAGLVKESDGEILFQGRSRDKDWRAYRLNCQMVFQDPYSSLDPRMTILALVEEALRLVPDLDSSAKRKRALETLEEVGLGGDYANRYPHELSGGQRQRVAIARAIARRPRFLIADEPVSALDVTVRAQVLDLFSNLQKRYGFSCLFISHDLGVVEQVADRVVVMQDGRIIEEGDRDAIFDHPKEAYTRRLLSAIPALDQNDKGGVTLKWRLEN